jgi:hypothetical protein
MTGVLNDGDDVRTVGCHANQVTAGTVGELDSVDVTSRTNDISNVTDGGTAGRTKVQNLRARSNVDFIETTQNTSSKLGTERIPDTVFGLGHGTVLSRSLNRNALLSVDSLSRGQVLGDKQVFLTATGDKDTGMTMGFLKATRVSCRGHRSNPK